LKNEKQKMSVEITRLPEPYDWYEHQKQAIKWMDHHEHTYNCGGLICAEMGLGKTLMFLTLSVASTFSGFTLIVCEKTILWTIVLDIRKFYPHIPLAYIESKSSNLAINIEAYGFIVCTYDNLLQIATKAKGWENMCALFRNFNFVRMVCDESHRFVNPKTRIARTLFEIAPQFRFRWCISGTPFVNETNDMFVQMKFAGCIDQRIRASKDTFVKNNLRQLHIYSLTIAESGIQLPPRYEHPVMIQLNEDEVNAYNQQLELANVTKDKYKVGQEKLASVLAMITKLQQICIDTRLINPSGTTESTKLKCLRHIVENVVPPTEKIIVYCKWKGVLDLIRLMYPDALYLDGDTSLKKRGDIIDAFFCDHRLLCMTHVGVMGLNLTCANHVVFMDIHWNMLPYRQGSARVWRIGQTRPCHIYRLLVKGSIEEYISNASVAKLNEELELMDASPQMLLDGNLSPLTNYTNSPI